MNPTDLVVRQADDLLTTSVDGDLLGMSIDRGTCYGFNATATRSWELLTEPQSLDSLCAKLLAEFEVNNRLLAVPGVAAVERLGGYLRQFQVQLDPERMSARRVSLDEVLHAVDESNLNASGGVIAHGPIEWTVRAVGRVQSIEDLLRLLRGCRIIEIDKRLAINLKRQGGKILANTGHIV